VTDIREKVKRFRIAEVFMEINKTISDLLKSKEIDVLDRSEIGKSLDLFESNSFIISNRLFTFLIENNLNKYLFGFFLREGTLEVNNLPFNMQGLNQEFLAQNIKETFIKKFKCKNCDNTLFRKHMDEIDYDEVNSMRCPICDTTYDFNFSDLEDDFTITRNDLIKYLNRLVNIGVLVTESKYVCPGCKRIEEFNQQSLECTNCGKKREVLNFYSFKDEFLKECFRLRDGRWFEWYVYKMCSHIYPSAEHNLIISFEEKGMKRECEIDVLSIDKKGEIVVLECKDYIKREVGFGEMENLITLAPLFGNIHFISSLKINKNAIRDIEKSLAQGKVNFIEGVHLEKQYLSEENILNLFVEGAIGAINIYSKLSELKRRKILLELIKRFSLSKGSDENMASAIATIFWGGENSLLKLMTGHNSELNELIKTCYTNLVNQINVEYSANCLKGIVSDFGLKSVLDLFSLEEVIKMGKDYLPLSYPKRRALYYFYWQVFNKYEGNLEISQAAGGDFIKKFIPMLEIYYGGSSRDITLKVIELFWGFTDDDAKQNFIRISKQIIDSNVNGTIIPKIINFIIKNNGTFSKIHNPSLIELLNKHKELTSNIQNVAEIDEVINKLS
jgi:hypothetical protein